MKIKMSDLRKLIKEVAVSPAVFQNSVISDPMEKQSIAKAVTDLEHAFKTTIITNMVISMPNKFNKETRDFDDGAMDQIKSSAEQATESLMSKVNSVLKERWQYAHRYLKRDGQ